MNLVGAVAGRYKARSAGSLLCNMVGRAASSSAGTRVLSRPLPAGTWDSHMHVIEPNRFPLDASAKYPSDVHTLEDARSFHGSLGIENTVVVQPSIYGNDNSCTLEALRALTPEHGRAVVQFEPRTVEQRSLREWHELGVRGVRVNLVSVGREVDGLTLRSELEEFARVVRPLGWVLQLYMPLELADALEEFVPTLGVKVCIDHFGSPSLPDPFDAARTINSYEIPGFGALIKMLQQRDVWLKISGFYRVTKDPPGFRDLHPLGRELMKEAKNRVVFATDWPHTRFEHVDTVGFIEACYDWCGNDDGVIEKLFRTNAEELWDVT